MLLRNCNGMSTCYRLFLLESVELEESDFSSWSSVLALAVDFAISTTGISMAESGATFRKTTFPYPTVQVLFLVV
jgi:hypothetical protein